MYEDVSGANNLVKLDANAKIPAGAATNLTNLPGPEKSSSDPTISSNKAVGTQWLNTSSGELYVCTDATAGENVWKNVGAGTGDVEPWAFQGLSYGYTSGGWPSTNVIDKFSFTSDGNAVDVGDMTTQRTDGCGLSSASYGWTCGGRGVPWGTQNNVIDKFSFSSDGNATDSGDLLTNHTAMAGQSSTTYGYISGGKEPTAVNSIQKFAFVSGGNSAAISGVLTVTRRSCVGVSSATHAYTVGGKLDSGPYSNVIDKFPFATDANSTDVGDLTQARSSAATASSTTHGFMGGGQSGSGSNVVDKWSFTSDGNAVDHGDLSASRYGVCGQSATAYGYSSGGYVPSAYSNIIDKYAYTSNTTATDVGNLTVARGDRPHGHQV